MSYTLPNQSPEPTGTVAAVAFVEDSGFIEFQIAGGSAFSLGLATFYEKDTTSRFYKKVSFSEHGWRRAFLRIGLSSL